MEYITTKEASKKWGISTSRITLLANQGRIPGAYRLGKSWLIPSGAKKPEALKPSRRGSAKESPEVFSFPLYHFRPDWNSAKEEQLLPQQQILLQAETAVLECRFDDAYSLLEPTLKSSDDIVTEICSLGLAGICCIFLNKIEDYSRIYLRLQMLLSEDFPHRDDLIPILNFLKTYVETIAYSSNAYPYNPHIHEQCIPMACVLAGFTGFVKEYSIPGSADISLLELILRFLKTTGAVIAEEFMRCHLMCIYSMRQEIQKSESHAKAIVQIVFENRFYLPLVSYYPYYRQVLDPILAGYGEDFREHLQRLVSQYQENFVAFLTSVNKDTTFAKLSSEDYSYTYVVYMGLSNTAIAKKLGISAQTVNRKILKICGKLGVCGKKELIEYLKKNT